MGCIKSKEEPKQGTEDDISSWCPRSHSPVFKNSITASMMTSMVRGMVNKMVAIEDNARDCTDEEVQEHEYQAWHEDEKKKDMWDSFVSARPYSVKGYESQAPKVGDNAPDGEVLSMEPDGEPSTLLAEVKALGKKAGSSFVGLSFDSLSCPVWRMYGGYDLCNAMNGVDGIKFPVLHVYTREAHGSDDFDASPNVKGPMALTRQLPMHKTAGERRQAATEAQSVLAKQLGSKGDSTHWVLDNMDDSLEKAYEARPFRFFILNIETGTVAYANGMCPFNIPAKIKDIQEFCTSKKA